MALQPAGCSLHMCSSPPYTHIYACTELLPSSVHIRSTQQARYRGRRGCFMHSPKKRTTFVRRVSSQNITGLGGKTQQAAARHVQPPCREEEEEEPPPPFAVGLLSTTFKCIVVQTRFASFLALNTRAAALLKESIPTWS